MVNSRNGPSTRADQMVTQQVIDGLQKEGTCWCGSTLHQGRRAMRISVSSWATTDDDCRQSLDAIRRIASEVIGA